MEAGKLDRLIRIEQMVETRVAGSREVTREWVLRAQVWAAVQMEPTTEGTTADQPAAIQQRVFVIRYREGMSPTEALRIVHQGRAFDITDVEEVGRRDGMKLRAYARAEAAA